MGYRYKTHKVLGIDPSHLSQMADILSVSEFLDFKIRTAEVAIKNMVDNFSTEEMYEHGLMDLMAYRKNCIETWSAEINDLKEAGEGEL